MWGEVQKVVIITIIIIIIIIAFWKNSPVSLSHNTANRPPSPKIDGENER